MDIELTARKVTDMAKAGGYRGRRIVVWSDGSIGEGPVANAEPYVVAEFELGRSLLSQDEIIRELINGLSRHEHD